MKPFEKHIKEGRGNRSPERKRFKPTLGVFAEDPEEEEELGKQEQKRAAEEAKKPKVPKRSTGGLGFSQVERKFSKKPGLPTIEEVDEGEQNKPDNTPSRKNDVHRKSR